MKYVIYSLLQLQLQFWALLTNWKGPKFSIQLEGVLLVHCALYQSCECLVMLGEALFVECYSLNHAVSQVDLYWLATVYGGLFLFCMYWKFSFVKKNACKRIKQNTQRQQSQTPPWMGMDRIHMRVGSHLFSSLVNISRKRIQRVLTNLMYKNVMCN